jgi:hypothetical protein
MTSAAQLKPPVIVWFQRLMIVRWIIIAIHTAIVKHKMDLAMAAQTAQIRTILARHPYMQMSIIFSETLVDVLITTLVFYLVVRQRNPIGQVILASWLVMILFLHIYVAATHHLSATHIAFSVYSIDILLAACVWLLSRPDAKKWFAGRSTNPNVSAEFE